MSDVGKIEVVLDLDSGVFTTNIISAGRQLRRFETDVNGLNQSVSRIDRGVNGLGARFRDLSIILGQSRNVILGVWAATGGWVKHLITANMELERSQKLLEGMSASLDPVQRKLESISSLNYFINLSRNAPFALDSITSSAVKLKAGGIDPLNGSLTKLIDGVAAFGGDSEVLKRATIAIQQMAGKGVISMEELRQQLGEAVPSAMKMMARGLNMTMSQLTKAVSSGTVESQSAIDAMLRQFEIGYGGAAKSMMDTTRGLVAQVKTELTMVARNIGGFDELGDPKKGGMMAGFNQTLRDLLMTMKSPEFGQFGRDLGRTLGEIMRSMMQGAKWIFEYRAEIWLAVKALIAFKAAGMALTTIKSIYGVITVFSAHVNKLTADLTRSTGQMLTGASATSGFRTGLASLGGVVRSIINPATLAVTAIGLLIGKFVQAKIDASSAADAIKRFNEEVREGRAGTESDAIAARVKIAQLNALVAKAEKRQGSLYIDNTTLTTLERANSGESLNTPYTNKVFSRADGNKIIADAKAQIDELTASLRDSARIGLTERATQRVQSTLDAIAEIGESTRRKMDAELNLIDVQLNDPSSDVKAADAIKLKTKVYTDTYDGLIESVKDKEAELAKAMAKSDEVGPAAPFTETSAAQRQLAALYQERIRLEAMKSALIKDLNGPKILAMKGAGAGDKLKDDPLGDFLVSLRGKIAGLRAEAIDANVDLAKFEQLLQGGKYGNGSQSDARLAKIREELTVFNELKEAKKAEAEREKIEAKALEFTTTKLASLTADLASEQERADGNVYNTAARGMATLTRQIAVQREQLGETSPALAKYEADWKRLIDVQQKIDVTKFIGSTDSMIAQGTASRAGNDASRRIAETELEITRILDYVATFEECTEKRVQLEESATLRIQELRAQLAESNKTPLQKMVTDWADTTTQMGDLYADAMSGMSDQITNLITTGKMDFKSFADDIIKQLTRIMVQKAMANMIGSMFGGGGGAATTGFALGGIQTQHGPVPLKKYARGGIATSPQLALFGEGSLPEAYVPLPDGRSIPVTMRGGTGGQPQQQQVIMVNVINQTTEDVQGEQQGGPRFDAEKMILDVVLTAVSKPSKFRDGMKSSMSR